MKNKGLKQIDDISFEGVEIKLGGNVKHLNFTFLGLKMLAKKYGSVEKALSKLSDRENNDDYMNEEMFDILSSFVMAGLIHENRKLTQDDVECWLNVRNMEYCFEKISEAMGDSLPEGEDTGNA